MSLIPYKARILVGAISLALKERKKFSQTIFIAPNKRKELIKGRAQQKKHAKSKHSRLGAYLQGGRLFEVGRLIERKR